MIFNSFLANGIFGNSTLFAVFIIFVIALIMILSRTPLNQSIVFLTLPIYALSKSGYFGGIVSSSILPLTIIFLGTMLASNIKKLVKQ